MEKTIIDERTGWEYELIGEQYYPTGRVMRNGALMPGELPEDNGPGEEKPIGVWGQRHLRYIRQYKKSLYLDLFMSRTLNAYLADIDTQAEDSFSRLVEEMAAREGVTEKLKAEDQMAWVGRMNNIRERATEIVNRDLIYGTTQTVCKSLPQASSQILSGRKTPILTTRFSSVCDMYSAHLS